MVTVSEGVLQSLLDRNRGISRVIEVADERANSWKAVAKSLREDLSTQSFELLCASFNTPIIDAQTESYQSPCA